MALIFVSASVAGAENVQAEIDKGNAAVIAAYAKGDTAKIASLYTADGVIIPPGGAIIKGQAAVAAFWQGALDGGLKLVRLKTTDLSTTSLDSGDLACEMGVVTLALPDGTEVKNRYIVVWKHEDGGWKLHRDIWNSGQ